MHVLDFSQDPSCLPCMPIAAAALMPQFIVLEPRRFVKRSAHHKTEACWCVQSHLLCQASVCGAMSHPQLTFELMVTIFMQLYLCAFCL